MATFILVHGGNMSTDTWNRLSGRNRYPPGGLLRAKIWDDTAAFLRDHGHRVLAPDLADEHTHGLTDHIGQVRRLVEKEDSGTIILAGHSYGGMVVTGVAGRIPARIGRLVYIDAAPPDPGQSLFDLFIAGGFDPLSFAGLEATKAYVEKLQFDPGKTRTIPRTYVRCTKSEFIGVTEAAKEKIAAEPAGWRCLELPTSHVPMATMPLQLNRMLLDEANR
ncbi:MULTISPECIES: alpha/beta fold hydrolase [unclassified Methanoregula]|uniref:alpha/beta fold hydrolase n=1 Tax=unclassified Methanoregula TaxID=2649730 RepID=UPI0009CF4BDB|nr:MULTISPECIES: alpha/beta fold hydrolase [unclassified Methanoregula]OPX63991.1 MAG: Alpha/beta hydrolase family protein [Methanoregula sp. PtaB.Bin085]OPY33811.1 MAG: Alpha/beta hydrolase family protein [Methanoregula sp. PtaU1.Bin006]